MSNLRLSIIQFDIVWENKTSNLKYIQEKVNSLQGKSDLVILPEMFTTGFTNNCSTMAESMNGPTLQFIQKLSTQNNLAITGSLLIEEDGNFYNRLVFVYPSQKILWYDKKHLFRLGAERNNFTAGSKNVILPYLGWNIALQVCYDLRFPVWSRNNENSYDLLIYVANWPHIRIGAWKSLLQARAIENMSYVCGVNRIGTDANKLSYSGQSLLFDAKGALLLPKIVMNKESCTTLSISKKKLDLFRQKFPVWRDADPFTID